MRFPNPCTAETPSLIPSDSSGGPVRRVGVIEGEEGQGLKLPKGIHFKESSGCI